MRELIGQLETEMEKFLKNAKAQLDGGNKAAGLRARRISIDMEPKLKLFRKLSLDVSGFFVIILS